jgi:hypothetical protein
MKLDCQKGTEKECALDYAENISQKSFCPFLGLGQKWHLIGSKPAAEPPELLPVDTDSAVRRTVRKKRTRNFYTEFIFENSRTTNKKGMRMISQYLSAHTWHISNRVIWTRGWHRP